MRRVFLVGVWLMVVGLVWFAGTASAYIMYPADEYVTEWSTDYGLSRATYYQGRFPDGIWMFYLFEPTLGPTDLLHVEVPDGWHYSLWQLQDIEFMYDPDLDFYLLGIQLTNDASRYGTVYLARNLVREDPSDFVSYLASLRGSMVLMFRADEPQDAWTFTLWTQRLPMSPFLAVGSWTAGYGRNLFLGETTPAAPAPVPEPATVWLLVAGGVAAVAWRRRAADE